MQPYGERLGKIFRRMRLRVPCIEVQDVAAAVRFWLVRRRILLGERSERTDPPALEVQPESVIERMAGLVPENPHTFNVGAAFNLTHEFSLELH